VQDIPDLKGYIDKRKKYVTVEVGRISWTMKLVRSDGKRLGGVGWREFAKENDLEEGDVCIFELVLRNDSVFKVHIFKSQS